MNSIFAMVWLQTKVGVFDPNLEVNWATNKKNPQAKLHIFAFLRTFPHSNVTKTWPVLEEQRQVTWGFPLEC